MTVVDNYLNVQGRYSLYLKLTDENPGGYLKLSY